MRVRRGRGLFFFFFFFLLFFLSLTRWWWWSVTGTGGPLPHTPNPLVSAISYEYLCTFTTSLRVYNLLLLLLALRQLFDCRSVLSASTALLEIGELANKKELLRLLSRLLRSERHSSISLSVIRYRPDTFYSATCLCSLLSLILLLLAPLLALHNILSQLPIPHPSPLPSSLISLSAASSSSLLLAA